MTNTLFNQQPLRWERATAIAERDQLRPIPSTQPGTDEPIWLVQSRNNPARVYTLTVAGDTIHCQCVRYRHRGICAHAAAVRLVLQAQQPPAPAVPATRALSRTSSSHPARSVEQRRTEERRLREEAARRECALLWTDDRPFSLFKE